VPTFSPLDRTASYAMLGEQKANQLPFLACCGRALGQAGIHRNRGMEHNFWAAAVR
jgi:hypothetical protein